MTLCR